MTGPWDCMCVSWNVRDARVVAILDHEGGAVVEDDVALRFNEGRHIEGRKEGEGFRYVLAYDMNFTVLESPEPDASETAKALIVISGTHENGRQIEIRGPGWIGYDDHGSLEGYFEEPPHILIDEVSNDPEPDAEAGDAGKRTPEEWLDHMRNVEPRPSEQYLKALAGRRLPDELNGDR